MKDYSSYLIIGNDKLSKTIRKHRPDISYISSREILRKDPKDKILGRYTKIAFTGQLTRRKVDESEDILSFNTQLASYIAHNANPAAHIVYVSSIDVFGKSAEMPLHSNTTLSKKYLDEYAESKVISEQILTENHSGYLNKIRCPGLYGCCTSEGSIVSRMFMSALKENTIHLTDGKIKRPILSYNYCANFILNLFDENSYRAGQTSFTIGPNWSISLQQIAHCTSMYFKENYGREIVIDKDCADTSAGRDRVIETEWAKEGLQYGYKQTEDPIDAIISALSVYDNEVNMLR